MDLIDRARQDRGQDHPKCWTRDENPVNLQQQSLAIFLL